MNNEAKLNPAAAALLAQITTGTVLVMPKKPWVEASTVSHVSEKSVHFTDGSYTNKRSLANFAIA